jgi:hypothetical protein
MLFFCNQPESISHFLFQCPVAKIIWVVVAKCFGANTISGIWNNVGDGVINGCLSFGKKYHVWGVAAICWAIWKSRNKACFEEKSYQ